MEINGFFKRIKGMSKEQFLEFMESEGLRIVKKHDIPCSNCDGKGTIWGMCDSWTCHVCHGSGRIYIE